MIIRNSFMDISHLRLFFDVGLLTLIWIVQMVIYPGFLYYNSINLVQWHAKYTTNFSYIVVPLMLGQLLMAIFQLVEDSNLIHIAYFILVVSSWLFTFILFVPIHSKISQGLTDNEMLRKLVRNNWIRTMIWTLLFFLSFYEKFLK